MQQFSESSWISGLFKKLRIENLEPISLKCGNKALIHIATNLFFKEKTKHARIYSHFVREKL